MGRKQYEVFENDSKDLLLIVSLKSPREAPNTGDFLLFFVKYHSTRSVPSTMSVDVSKRISGYQIIYKMIPNRLEGQ